MSEVERLFECFKCGISPPQSAVRSEKRATKKEKAQEAVPLPSENENPQKIADAEDSASSKFSIDNKQNLLSCTRKRRHQISPKVFYGSPFGIPPKRPISLLRLLREIHADLAEQSNPSSSSREEVWATFPRQNEAMNFAKEHGKDLRLFCYQDHRSGQRRYLVSTYKTFWKRYKTMDPNHRHHYEVIQEGLPCHLYFDLEFNKRENPNKNGDEMVEILVSIIFNLMLKKYSIEGNDSWVIELDSSTSEKFSRHLIIRLPKAAFKDNSHVGAFVSEIMGTISSLKEINKDLEKLYIKKDSSFSHIFVDQAVYTRNRCFRLAFSSKAGKASFLRPSARFGAKEMDEEELFMRSLICQMGDGCSKLLVCKMDLDCMKKLLFETEENYSVNDSLKESVPLESQYGRSPFPDIDRFVESIASNGSETGKIRSWYWFSEELLVVYSMSRNRYCERIGREHKSNHVIYVVDLRRGTFYQKCHDPDCQGYRSPLRQIPFHMMLGLSAPNSGLTSGSPPSCGKESWWVEAIQVAEELEKGDQFCGRLDIDEVDDSWWIAVESSLSQL